MRSFSGVFGARPEEQAHPSKTSVIIFSIFPCRERHYSFFPSRFCLCSISCGSRKSRKAQKTTGGSIERAGATDCRLRAWLNCTRIITLRHLHVCIQVFVFVMVSAGHPTAVCRTSACGYCHREWYDGVTGRIINCTGTLTDRSVCVWVHLSVCLCLCMRRGSRVQGS